MNQLTFDVTDFTPPWVSDVINRLRTDNEQLREALLEAIGWSYDGDATPERRAELEALASGAGRGRR